MQTAVPQDQPARASDNPLVVPLSDLDASMIPLAGGKAANLGELIHAALPVPGGFCVTTAAYELVSRTAGLEPTLDELATLQPGDIARLEKCASTARAAISSAPIPTAVVQAV